MTNKKLLVLMAWLCLSACKLMAQAPQQINYQAVVRNASGQPVAAGTPVAIRFIIHDLTAAGTVVFQELQHDTANQFGLINTEIGLTASLTSVNWGTGAKYLQIETDVNNTGTFTDMGVSQLLSVPYALFSANGTTGPQGPVGPQGPQGPTGANGTNGVNGATGATGLQGPTGANGPTGVNGATGATGSNGTNGINGATGATGLQGPTGANGTNGVNGVTGATGANGTNGINGNTGATGATGLQGPTGANGTNGVNGATGATGANGTNGINGSTGATGATGLQGPTGANGTNGVNGATGATGANGTNGINGSTGATGVTGATGADGAQNAWGLTGNSGTTAANFIGTTDTLPLYIKTNDSLVGYLPSTLLGNIIFGQGNYVPAGRLNVSIGTYTTGHNETGSYNVAIGAEDLAGNTSGQGNVAVGLTAMPNNTTGNNNVSLGTSSMYSNINGNNNIALGSNTLFEITAGNSNVAIGSNALLNLTSGNNNIAIGNNAGFADTGTNSVFLGPNAGYNETGSNKLYIANSRTTTPLIYGDFANNHITINDSLTARYFQMTTGAVNGYILQSNATGNATWVNPALMGVTGATGPTGATGLQGLQGATGIAGATGAQGATGAMGATGVAGPTGAAGANGMNGITGATGLQGVTGATGAPGSQNAWGLTGNTGTTNINFIGTADSTDLILKTDNAERMRIKASGQVSIGTSTPGYQVLTVNGNAEFWNHGSQLFYTDSGNSVRGALGDFGNNSDMTIASLPDSNWLRLGSNNGNIAFFTDASYNIFSNNASKVVITPAVQMGIGTTTPNTALQVMGTTGTTNFKMTNGATNGYVLQSDSSGNGTWVNDSALIVNQAWSLKGNKGTTAANFIGTTDSTRFTVRTNNNNQILVGKGTAGDNKNYGVVSVGMALVPNLQQAAIDPYAGMELNGDGTSVGDFAMNAVADNNFANFISSSKARGNFTTPAIVQNTDQVMDLVAFGYDGTGFKMAANIGINVDSVPAAGSMPGNITFGTSSVGEAPGIGSSSTTERMRITNRGYVGIGTTTPASTLHVNGKTTTNSIAITTGASAGYLLQSDAAGNGSWVNPATFNFPNIYTADGSLTSQRTVNMGADNLTFSSTTGNLIFSPLSTGKVGIGTSAPAYPLEVVSPGATGSTFSTALYAENSTGYQDALNVRLKDTITDLAADYKGPYAIKTNLTFSTNAAGVPGTLTERVRITSAGNVGIGTTAPAANLHVVSTGETVAEFQSNYTAGTWLLLDNTSTGGNTWRMISTGSANAEGTGNLLFRDNNAVRMMIQSSTGNVGIGTTSPTQAALVVNGSQNDNISYGFLNSTGSTGTSSGNNGYSIYASSRIAATEFDAYSDARIKNIMNRTDNAADLNTLTQLQITNYHFIDTLGKGNKLYKKVIAQEVEKVYPNAVSKLTDVVPDIYKMAAAANNRISVTNNLKAGDRVKLITTSTTEIYDVVTADADGFTVNHVADGQVFVYGREVKDFRAVDYEALTTLNISATQELVKMINTLQHENTEVKNKLASVTNDVEAIKQALDLKKQAQR